MAVQKQVPGGGVGGGAGCGAGIRLLHFPQHFLSQVITYPLGTSQRTIKVVTGTGGDAAHRRRGELVSTCAVLADVLQGLFPPD